MKLTTLLLTIAFVQVSAASLAQKVTLEKKNISLEAVFQSIESQTDYVFFYEDQDLEDVVISIQLKEVSLEDALKTSLHNLSFRYRIINKTIVITRDAPQGKLEKTASAAIVLRGRVTDPSGSTMPGTNVKIKNTDIGTITDKDGDYTIDVPSENDVLVFSFIGFKTVEYPVGKRQKLDVTLQEDIGKLDEVRVVGYGTSTKKNLTGSVSRISGEVIQRQPTNDPMAALQGRVAGLQITNTSGLPGASVNIQIRGTNSLNKEPDNSYARNVSNSPLYIVDGVPFISDPLNAANAGNAGSAGNLLGIQRGGSLANGLGTTTSSANIQNSPFKSINPADIESIEVLKDADATAIYGARGANGVILITTKRGKAGKPQLSIDAYTGISRVPKYIDMLNTPAYLAMRREAFRNAGVTPTSDPNDFLGYAPDLTIWDTTAYTNWQKKYAGSTAQTSTMQASFSGGSKQIRYFFNGGYRNQTTVYGHEYGLKQGSARLNLDYTSLNKRFTSLFSMAYSADKNKALPVDPFFYYNLAPNAPLYQTDGSLSWNSYFNPEASALKSYTDQTRNLNSNLVVAYELLAGLNVKSSFGYNRMVMEQLKLDPIASVLPPAFGGLGYGTHNEATNTAESWLIEPQINYSLFVGSGRLQSLLGGTYQQSSSASLWVQGSNYQSDEQLSDLTAAPRIDTITSLPSKYKYGSAFLRLNYNWKEKYIINGTLRTDGSSRFGPGKRFGTFGAVGTAWIFSQEPWLKGKTGLSFGKLRGSYGITGNDKVGDYQYYNTYVASTNSNWPTVYQTPGVYSDKLFNADYRWETNKKLEIALDLGVANDRIFLTIDYYRNRSGNQLVSYPLATQSGYGTVTANLDAVVQNSGLEMDLITTNIKKKAFTWTTAFNISWQRNKLVRFPGLEGSPYRNIYTVGKSISNTQGYLYEGINAMDGTPIFKDVDGNGEFETSNAIDKKDQTTIANALPDFYGGISNSFTYQGWQLDVFFNFRKLDKVFYREYGFGSSSVNEDHSILNHWQKPGDVAAFPRYSTSFSDAFFNTYPFNNSTATLYNGSYIRLSNLSLSYTLPANWTKAIRTKQVRLYALGQNLFTITKYPGPDPETGVGVPTLRTLTLGAKITF